MIYVHVDSDVPVSQGDVFDDCPVLFWDHAASFREATSARVRAVVLTQACDLAQSKATRVLVAVLHDAKLMVDRGMLAAKVIREQIRMHRVFGWYFLPAGPEIDECVIDLRDLHTLPRELLEFLIADGKRLCRIQTPYREHLAQHFATTYSRIGLPDLYETRED